MKEQLKDLVDHLLAKNDSLWIKAQEKEKDPYDFGYMSALEYVVHKINKILDEN